MKWAISKKQLPKCNKQKANSKKTIPKKQLQKCNNQKPIAIAHRLSIGLAKFGKLDMKIGDISNGTDVDMPIMCLHVPSDQAR